VNHDTAMRRPPVPLISGDTGDSGDVWALFLDVDGTLLEIAGTPDAVAASGEIAALLARLRPLLGGALALISGRRIDDLDAIFAPLILPAAGLHGLERRDARGRRHGIVDAPALDALRAPLRDFAAAHPGAMLEDKGQTLALHYRQAPGCRDEAKALLDALLTGRQDLQMLEGKMVFEIRPRRTDKGDAIAAFLAEPPFAGRRPVFLGDDATDEDGFRLVNDRGGVSIRVDGEATVRAQTAARYRLADVGAVAAWLARVAKRLESTKQGTS